MNPLRLLLPALLAVTFQAAAGDPPYPGKESLFENRFTMFVDGRNRIVVPKKAAEGKPWVWRARFWRHEPQFDLAMLEKGYHVVYCDVSGLLGNPTAVQRWNDYYAFLTTKLGFDPKPVLEGMSRGGMIIYNWAIANPDKVGAIYGDAPVMDLRSWPGADHKMTLKAYGFADAAEAKAFTGYPVDNLKPLAEAKVPIIHVVGDKDTTVPVDENTAVAEKRYKKLGGTMEVIHKPETGHHPHSLKDPAPIVTFIEKHAERKAAEPAETTINGHLQRIKIGFDPPGWAVTHQTEGTWQMTEVDMKHIDDPEQFERAAVTITGTMTKVLNRERGTIPVLVAKSVTRD